MQNIREASEVEVIAEFLRAELDSSRYRDRTLGCLNANEANEALIRVPNLLDPTENRARAKVLGCCRGWGDNRYMFEDFPVHVEWFLSRAEDEDTEKIWYAKSGDWDELSGFTRLPSNSAHRIRLGLPPDDPRADLADVVISVDRALTAGGVVPPSIVIATREHNKFVILEGFARTTALMYGDRLEGAEVLLGLAPVAEVEAWSFW